MSLDCTSQQHRDGAYHMGLMDAAEQKDILLARGLADEDTVWVVQILGVEVVRVAVGDQKGADPAQIQAVVELAIVPPDVYNDRKELPPRELTKKGGPT